MTKVCGAAEWLKPNPSVTVLTEHRDFLRLRYARRKLAVRLNLLRESGVPRERSTCKQPGMAYESMIDFTNAPFPGGLMAWASPLGDDKRRMSIVRIIREPS